MLLESILVHLVFQYSLQMKGCLRAGVKYKDGEEWHENACDTCRYDLILSGKGSAMNSPNHVLIRCKRGVAACSKAVCPKPPREFFFIHSILELLKKGFDQRNE